MHILSFCRKIKVYPRHDDVKFAVAEKAFTHECISYSSLSWKFLLINWIQREHEKIIDEWVVLSVKIWTCGIIIGFFSNNFPRKLWQINERLAMWVKRWRVDNNSPPTWYGHLTDSELYHRCKSRTGHPQYRYGRRTTCWLWIGDIWS